MTELPVPVAEFRRELRRACRAVGIQVRTSAHQDWFIAWNPDHVVTDEQRRETAEAVARAMTLSDIRPAPPRFDGPTIHGR